METHDCLKLGLIFLEIIKWKHQLCQKICSSGKKKVIVQIILVMVAIKRWKLHQMDVYKAFLHSDLQEEVFMKPPQLSILSTKYSF